MWGWLRERSNRHRALRETQLDRIERKIEMTDAKISDIETAVSAIAVELPNILTAGTNAMELLKQIQSSSQNPNTVTVLSVEDQTKLNTMLGQLQGAKVSADNLLTALTAATASPVQTPVPTAPPGATPPTGQSPQPSAPPAAPPPSSPAPTPPTS